MYIFLSDLRVNHWQSQDKNTGFFPLLSIPTWYLLLCSVSLTPPILNNSDFCGWYVAVFTYNHT